MATHELIVYGILRTRNVLERTIGHAWDGEYVDALVPEWTKYQKNSSPIWYASPRDGEVLEALLVRGLSDPDMARLDMLEGTASHHYDRVRVAYLSDDGEGEAWIYRDGEYRPLPSSEEITERAMKRIRDQVEGKTKDKTGRALRRTVGQAGGSAYNLEEGERRARLAGYQSLEDLANSMGITDETPTDGGRFQRIATTGSAYTGSPTVNNDGTSGGSRGRTRRPVATPQPGAPFRPLPLFAYGSLTFREVLEERIDHQWSGEYRPASLPGWRIEPGWPRHAVPERGAVAHGFILPGLTEEDLDIIDRFEGVHNDVYRRVVVTLTDGTEAYFYSTGSAGHRRLARRKAGTEPTRRPFISGQKVTA